MIFLAMDKGLISSSPIKLKEHTTTTELIGNECRQWWCLSQTNKHCWKSLQLPPKIHLSVKCFKNTNLFPLRYKQHYDDDGFLKCHNHYIQSTLAHPSTALQGVTCKKKERFNICIGLILLHSKHLKKAVLEEAAGQLNPLEVPSPIPLVLLLPLPQTHSSFQKVSETESNRSLSHSAAPEICSHCFT